ncbi:MAG: bifunctional riboflavin kinase/FAD synthetase [candidate division KSB1 bacterium]|nr:bifunctional riboflavin kinase/FAD synthetase [candidate division KSB1 bacterium]MDZ7303490.1 bifunctional riboflavin kinase/FAD synthetase [candidate division KSB1 bacterium]MDZ7312708.1 bifunctional riboflavin kinase/FAD synthetase [candidate division KSB1 bacterium]
MATRIYRRLEEVQFDPRSVITVGTFDGLHCGHQAIIRTLKEQAQLRHASTTVITFDPHPQMVVQRSDKPPVQILTTTEEKAALLREENIDRIVVIPFTLEFSRTSSEAFVREILFQRIGMQAMVIGHDHGFGKNREGDFTTLQKLGKELGFTVHELPPFRMDGVTLSSTRVREALLQGEVEKAARYLGRPYCLRGTVTGGEGRGKLLGFPTANLLPNYERKLVPANGVYAVWVEGNLLAHGRTTGQSNSRYPAMMNIGYRPTFGKTARSLEVHVIDFSGDLYGAALAVHFVARLRNEQKFDSAQALVEQLWRDKETSYQVLKNERASF